MATVTAIKRASKPAPQLTDYFPKWLADYVKELATEMQVPTDAVAVLALGAVAIAVNGGANTRPYRGWNEPVVLYVLALLGSGEGKSPVFARLLDPVLAASESFTKKGVGGVMTQKTRNRIRATFMRKYEANLMKDVADGTLDMELAVQMVAEKLEEIENGTLVSGTIPIRVLTDASPAATFDGLAANRGRLVIAAAEAEALLNFRGGNTMNTLLQAFDGERITQARRTVGNGELTITDPRINMMVAMQPSNLPKLGGDMVNRGVMPRFVASYAASLIGSRLSRTPIVSGEVSDEYEDQILRIVQKFSKAVTPIDITWEPAAVKDIIPWRDEIEPQMAPGQPLAPIRAWGSKVKGAHLIRLAALLAIMNDREKVNLDDVRKAEGMLRLLMVDAMKAFGEMGASFAEDDLTHLRGVLDRIEADPKHTKDTFAKRDVVRRSNRFTDFPERCDAVLQRAVDEGLLEVVGTRWRAVK